MADDAGGGVEGGTGGEGETAVAATGAEESADLGFYNRKLHNFPLIRVNYCSYTACNELCTVVV